MPPAHTAGPMASVERRQLRLRDGRELETYVAGPRDGAVLLFHFGSPSSGAPYAPFVSEAAKRGLRTITYSRAGYGASSRLPGRSVGDVAGDVSAMLDSVGAERCYVAGWSGGGPHALASAALLPDRVIAAASLAGVAPYPAYGLDWMAGMGEENVTEFGAALDGPERLREFLEGAGSWVATVTGEAVSASLGDLVSDVDKGAVSGDYAEWLAAGFRESVSSGIWGWFDDDMAFTRPWGFDLSAIRRPVAIWQGGQDRMVPFAHGEWLAGHVPDAKAHLLPEHGHLSLAVDSMGEILDDLLTLDD